ncbi:hypothetical protein O9H85_14625 [Paenibacillus filicis]|uniref:Uncharacterized protein n=1 Tax=Paenibacillus gyeongsangnamensis TaxID=3388067 RepID=A0ABT4Q9T7_9BACL|nr:hypothetical protein [Paenibacillus filicis]MCZ8513649.1 hypothetical protein [Paenibacillus filicis]
MTMPKGRMTGPFGVTNPLPDERAAVLKQYEQYAYQIAYYLLQDEAMARRAAEDTLTELYRQDSFFDLSGHGQGAFGEGGFHAPCAEGKSASPLGEK